MNNKQRQTAYNDKQQTMTKDKPQITTNDSCKWSSEGAGLLQMIIRRGRPLANVYTEGPASCKWSYGGAGLLQMIIWRSQHLANDHTEGPASPTLFYTPPTPLEKIYFPSTDCLQVLLTMLTTFYVLSMLYMLCRSDTWRTLTCYGAEELEELSWWLLPSLPNRKGTKSDWRLATAR